jgi:hypothetical protein
MRQTFKKGSSRSDFNPRYLKPMIDLRSRYGDVQRWPKAARGILIPALRSGGIGRRSPG